MTEVWNDDPRAYRVKWWSRRDPRIGATEPARRPYLTAEEADKLMAEKRRVNEERGWERIHVERAGPYFDERSMEQRRRDDLLAAVTAFIKDVDRSDFKDETGRMLNTNERLMQLRAMTVH